MITYAHNNPRKHTSSDIAKAVADRAKAKAEDRLGWLVVDDKMIHTDYEGCRIVVASTEDLWQEPCYFLNEEGHDSYSHYFIVYRDVYWRFDRCFLVEIDESTELGEYSAATPSLRIIKELTRGNRIDPRMMFKHEVVNTYEQTFDGFVFVGDDLRHATLCRSIIENSRLVGCDMRSAYMEGTVFRKCDLRGAYMSGNLLKNVVFDNCDLRGADFSNTRMYDPVFTHCDATGAEFRGAKIRNAVVQNVVQFASSADIILENTTK
jgi:hypothetical protein